MPISQELKQSLRERALYANAPTITANTNGDYSFGIVNSESNGKRVSISKSLSIKLELTDNLAILPMIDDGVVLLAKELPFPATSRVSIRGKEKKIAYSASLVHLLTEAFGLDYSARTSMSFSDIDFDTIDKVIENVITVALRRFHD